ncbi:MAG: AraC family transcriptional regulator [Bacteroidota bacterium]
MKPILEPILVGQRQSIQAFCYQKRQFETPWHFHPQHELTYIKASNGTKFIGDYVGAYEPGELVLLRSNLPHCWKTHQTSAEAAASYVVQWNQGIFAKIPELSLLFQLLKTASKGLIFDKKNVADLIPRIQRLHQLEGSNLYVQLLELLLQLTDCPFKTLSTSSFKKDLPNTYNSRMTKIHDFVEVHFNEKIYLKQLADLVNMTEPSFARFFKKMMGRSFFVFLNEYRINRVSQLLVDTDKSVTEIAFSCGYESLPFFHKQFNKFKKVSPSKYRKQF